MSRQYELEALALEIAAAPAVQAAREQARQVMLAAPEARTPAGLAALDNALEQHLHAAVHRAVVADPERPEVLAVSQYAHELRGQAFPAALHGGLENPDNIYRIMPLDGRRRYELHGRRRGAAPAQVTYDLMDSVPGVRSIGRQIGLLKSENMTVDEDGRFVIHIDSAPAAGRANHLRSTPDTRALMVRDTLSDWNTQLQDELRIVCLDPPTTPEKTREQLIDEAARLVVSFTTFWIDFRRGYLAENSHRQVNMPDLPEVRPGGWGFISNTAFRVAEDEALVITAHPFEARYHSILLGDPWWVGMDCAQHLGSLNASQAAPNADGSYTYVIATSDPGVHNWLDTAGLSDGYIQIRWQGLSPSITSAEGAIRGARLLKRSELRAALPPETLWLDAAQRREQLAQRHASYRRRLDIA